MWSNLQLWKKLAGGFSIILILTGIIAATGYVALDALGDRAKKSESVNDLVKGILDARITEKIFIKSNDPGQVSEMNRILGQLIESALITQKTFNRQVNRQRLESVILEVNAYGKAFAKYAELAQTMASSIIDLEEKAVTAARDAEKIGESQRAQLDSIREKSTARVADKKSIEDETNQLLIWMHQARTYRTILTSKDDPKVQGEWDEIGEQFLSSIEALKSKFTNQENIVQADFVISSFTTYREKFAQYLATPSKGVERAMARAENSAYVAIEGIREDQRRQLKEVNAEADRIIKDRLAKTRDANRLALMLEKTLTLQQQVILNGGEKEWLDAVRVNLSKISDLATGLKSRFKSEANLNQINGLINSVDGYAATFEKMAAIDSEQDQALKDMETAAVEARKACEAARSDQRKLMDDEIYSNKQMMILITGLGILIGVFLTLVITRSITRPVNKASGMAQSIRRGDLSQRLHLNQKDEIGELSQAFDEMADGLSAKAELAKRISSGDLTAEVDIASERDVLGQALLNMVVSLNDVLGQVRESVNQISAGSGQVSDSSQSLSQGASEQAANLEEITSSMTVIGSQTKENASNAGRAGTMADQARASIETSQNQMSNMIEAIQAISDSSREISKITKTIDDIAFQTNLLALNAAVEAARAGRHGKGFAVVAQEVRNLAARSAEAAREISELIDDSVNRIDSGTGLVKQTAASMSIVITENKQVNDLVHEIAASSNEQAEAISQINIGLEQVEQVTQQNSANAEETAAAAEQLSSQAAQLRHLLTRFRLRSTEESGRMAASESDGWFDEEAVMGEMPQETRFPLIETLDVIDPGEDEEF